MKKAKILSVFTFLILLIYACKEDEPSDPVDDGKPTPVTLVYPSYFPPPIDFQNNPLTEEGIKLGRHLFYDPRLSADSTQACADCHFQEFNFADFNQFSTGIDGIEGDKNAMAVANLAWQSFFFWDGREVSMEDQAVQPVLNPIEMHDTWENVVIKLKRDPAYVKMFEDAFGANSISQDNSVNAIAQFERMMVTANSKYDVGKVMNPAFGNFTAQEKMGLELFNNEIGDCFHCHAEPLFGAYGNLQFSNNGLDSAANLNVGRMAVTGSSQDKGKFKIPTLRNIEFSFPYMHDGRFSSLFEVIEHYNMGGHWSPTIDPNMKAVGVGKNWSQQQKDAMIAFMKTLTDFQFLNDTTFTSPY